MSQVTKLTSGITARPGEGALDSALVCACGERRRYLDLLTELLRIPSISALPEHETDVQRAADWLSNFLRQIGMTRIEVFTTAGAPIVYGEWLVAGEHAPALLVYGHYDVQPVDPVDEWHSPPFEPTIRGDNLYGRGASDDKGQFFTILASVDAYLRSSGRLPINLKIILEGEEEIGSPHTGGFIHHYSTLLAADAALICDHTMPNPTKPAITYGARGLVYLEVNVRGPTADLHSGTFGGAVDNPLNVLVYLLAALRDPVTRRIAIPGFYDQVLPISNTERALLQNGLITDESVRHLTGVPTLGGEEGFTTAERTTVRPTLDIHGVRGGFVDPGQKTVIPANASAKVSIRLVPDQDPQEVNRLVEAYLRSLAPPTVELEIHTISSRRPVVVDCRAPAIQAASRACELGFGAKPVLLRVGGTDPVVGDLQDALNVPVVMIGFGLPDDNSHAPNENLHLPNFYRGIETVIYYLAILAEEHLC